MIFQKAQWNFDKLSNIWTKMKKSLVFTSLKPIFRISENQITGTQSITNIHCKWVDCLKILGHLLTKWTMFWNFWILLESNLYFTFVAETDMKIPKTREIGIVTWWNILTPSTITIPTHKKNVISQTSEWVRGLFWTTCVIWYFLFRNVQHSDSDRYMRNVNAKIFDSKSKFMYISGVDI